MGEWRQVGGLLEGVSGPEASQFPPAVAELSGRRSTNVIREALRLDQEDACAAGEVGFRACEPVQALRAGLVASAEVAA
jgi:hypothetical protein